MTDVSSIPSEARARIEADLARIEGDEGVRILFAIESGSRAWGFPSPDSDFDVRFVYARRLEDYLTVHPVRDVIELPIEHPYDTNGWDIRKALGLLLKANPVLLEWLQSPIRYRWDADAADALLALARKVGGSAAALHHYRSLASRQWKTYLEGRDVVNLKKYFYAARPALTLEWLKAHPGEVAPMNWDDLLAGVSLPRGLLDSLSELRRLKSEAAEVGEGARRPEVDALIADAMAWAEAAASDAPRRRMDLQPEADALLARLIKGELA